MDFVKIFLLIAAISSAVSAEGGLSCYYEDVYEMWYLVDYYCVLNIDNDAGTDDFALISGEHPGNLTDSDVQTVYGMAARDDSVKIVPSIVCSKFTGLLKLWLDDLAIKTVTDKSFADCRNLEDLYLGYNELTLIPFNAFDENRNLRILDLGHNHLRRVPSLQFYFLNNLQQLHLDHNRVEFVEKFIFSNTSQLALLNLDGNEITALQSGIFQSLGSLEVLQVNSNKLTAINANAFAAESLVNFTEIQAAFNEISAVDLRFFDKVPNLKTASFDKNLCVDKTFEDFDVNRAENLAEFRDCGFNYESSGLTCQNWRLGFIDGRVFACVLDIFNPYARDDFEEIRLLNGGSTSENITIVYGESSRSGVVRIVPSRICSQFTNLVELYLDGLGIELMTEDAFFHCTNLEGLYLGHNLIEAIPDIVFLWNSRLKFLDLGSNQLRKLSTQTSSFNSLEHFYLDHNPLDEIDSYFFNSMINLKSLWLSGTKIGSADPRWFFYLTRLEDLRLDDTNIASIAPTTFASLINLKTLQLSSNNFEALTINFIPLNVTELHFSHNKIDSISPGFFDALQQLRLVSFEGNECVDEKIEDFSAARGANLEKFAKCFENFNQSGSGRAFVAKVLIILGLVLLF